MPPVGFKPTISAAERPKTYGLDRTATGTSGVVLYKVEINQNSLHHLSHSWSPPTISYGNPLVAYISSISKQFSPYIFLIQKSMLGFHTGLQSAARQVVLRGLQPHL
jgi:hypothetical protein